jgi:hypothetical protein
MLGSSACAPFGAGIRRTGPRASCRSHAARARTDAAPSSRTCVHIEGRGVAQR